MRAEAARDGKKSAVSHFPLLAFQAIGTDMGNTQQPEGLDKTTTDDYLQQIAENTYEGAMRYALRLCKNQADAEDIVQDAFLLLSQFLLSRPPTSLTYPEAYLQKIIKNSYFNSLRKGHRQPLTISY